MTTIAQCGALLEHDQLLAVRDLWRKTGRHMESTIQGGSMHPTLPEGSRILIRPAEEKEYVVGAVVACLQDDFLYAHRIALCGQGRRSGYVITQGDAWILCDPPVRTADIVGIVDARLVNGEWTPLPALERSPRNARAARRHAWAMGMYLQLGVGVAYRMSRLLVKLYTFRNKRRRTP